MEQEFIETPAKDVQVGDIVRYMAVDSEVEQVRRSRKRELVFIKLKGMGWFEHLDFEPDELLRVVLKQEGEG